MNPVEEAMEILMMFGKENCQIMDSGGKDSSVLKWIAMQCREKYGLEFQVVHNHTTIDAPETVYFVRRERERDLKKKVSDSSYRIQKSLLIDYA